MKIRSALAVMLATLGAITLTALPAAALDASCGMVITDRGTTVTFGSDLDCGTAPGITIATDDVTIDLNGHTFKGTTDSPYGIQMLGSLKRPTVKGGSIVGFKTAISVQSGFEVSLTDLRIKNTGADGIDMADSAYITIDNVKLDGTGFSTIFDEHFAVQIDRSHDMTISNVTERNWSGSGITVRYSHDYTIRDSSFLSNGANNIAIENDTTGAAVSNVTTGDSPLCVVATVIPDPGTLVATVTFDHVVATDCGSESFDVNYSYNVVLASVASHGGDYGVRITEDDHNVVLRDSTIEGAGVTGVVVQGFSWAVPVNTSIIGTTVDGSVGDGYFIQNALITSSGNSATNNGRDGFRWSTASGGTTYMDAATRNAGNGILVDTASTAPVVVTGATATQNGLNGLQTTSGLARVTNGSFANNGRQGLYAVGGRLDIASATASYNRHSGVFYAVGSTGSVAGTSMVKNRTYGLAVLPTAGFTDGGGNTFYRNGVSDRCARRCTL